MCVYSLVICGMDPETNVCWVGNGWIRVKTQFIVCVYVNLLFVYLVTMNDNKSRAW